MNKMQGKYKLVNNSKDNSRQINMCKSQKKEGRLQKKKLNNSISNLKNIKINFNKINKNLEIEL